MLYNFLFCLPMNNDLTSDRRHSKYANSCHPTCQLTLVSGEVANDAGLSMGLNSGGPVAMRRNLAVSSIRVEVMAMTILSANPFHLE